MQRTAATKLTLAAVGGTVAVGWALLGNGPAAPASCLAAGQTTVYSFRGVRFDDQPYGAYVHQDISGRTCGPRGIGVWRVTFVTTNNINPANVGTPVIEVVVKKAGQESFDATRHFSLTTLPGPKIRVWLHTAGVHTAIVPVAVKQGTCACPKLAKGQRIKRKASKAILDSIRKREKFRSKPYDDLGPGKGACTVGYGHVLHNSPCNGTEKPVTMAQAESIFQSDVGKSEADIANLVRRDLGQNQYDAILDFAFNAGIGGPGRAGLREALNNCDDDALFAQMRRYVTSKGKRLQELVNRREYEIALYQKQ